MALIIPEITLDNGLTIQNVYARIDSNRGNKDVQNYAVAYYISKDARFGGKEPLFQESFAFRHDLSESAVNVIKQGYLNLKALDRFAGAVDDLDY